MYGYILKASFFKILFINVVRKRKRVTLTGAIRKIVNFRKVLFFVHDRELCVSFILFF